MSDDDAGEAELAAAQHEAPRRLGAPHRLGVNGIGAVVILLMAAAAPGSWVSEPSLVRLLFRVLWVLIYMATLARLVQRFGTQWLTWAVRRQPALCVLLALTLASCLWSLDPLFTLHKATSLLATTVLGVFIGYACAPQRLMRVLHWTFTLLIVSSIVAALLLPVPGELTQVGWRGIMGDKNNFGAIAVLATIFLVVITLRRRIHPVWGVTLCIGGLFAVAQARSRTSFIALGVSLIVLATIASVTRRPTLAMMRRAALGLVLGVSVMPFLVGPLAALLGNDNPLNGRTHLWGGALTILRERPLTGYGYAAVWGRLDATLLPHIPVTGRRSAHTAHNEIVNVATELGIPAAIIACIYLFGALSNAARLYEREASTFSLFAVGFLVSTAVIGFAEAYLFRVHCFFWILFVALTVTVKRSLNGSTPTAHIGTQK